HGELDFFRVGFSFCFTLAIALSATCLVYMRDLYGNAVGLYAIIVTLTGAWMSDTGAYFFGITMGKRKLAPLISPKKTVEGALGGVVTALAAQLLFSYIYSLILLKLGIHCHINYVFLAICSPLISLVSMVGDLTASIIKRQCGIKDFGKIMPGHGGVLDRFDSVFMVIPFVYNLFLFFPLIQIK
ncbi:MAG: CDP-archaeol synthase, partial [Oscillospiraceae bacterium]